MTSTYQIVEASDGTVIVLDVTGHGDLLAPDVIVAEDAEEAAAMWQESRDIKTYHSANLGTVTIPED